MTPPEKLKFSPVTPGDVDRIYNYTSRFGEDSCQHSPISMWSLSNKYGDEFCEEDGYLYIHRSARSDERYRVYLAPFGQLSRETYLRIQGDAHAYGKRVKFYTLTKAHADFLKREFSQQYEITQERDLAEYIYSPQTFLEFAGKLHARRRTEIRSFWRTYENRAVSSVMTKDDIPEVLLFAEQWLSENRETHDEASLEIEMKGIRKQMEFFEELSLSGTILRIDDKIQAFCYGVALNDNCYDVLIEKGARDIPGIYRVLRQESTRLNVAGYSEINFEEDVGVPGLRKLKESYGPIRMIEKYIASER